MEELALEGAPPEIRAALREVREGFATIGASEPLQMPSAGLRDRILGTLRAQASLASKTSRRAVLVLDMLNDHLTEGLPFEVPRARAIVPALAARLDQARRVGESVIYVMDAHDPDDADLDLWGTHNVRGSKGAEVWPALAPESGDRIVNKSTYSAFVQSKLDDLLTELKVDTILLTGCLTEVGILATATDALQRGYAVEIAPELQAGAAESHEQIAMRILSFLPPYGPARKKLLERLAA